jgi:hypothetical protein
MAGLIMTILPYGVAILGDFLPIIIQFLPPVFIRAFSSFPWARFSYPEYFGEYYGILSQRPGTPSSQALTVTSVYTI